MELVVAVLVVVPAPLGFTIVKVTDAPDAALPPTVTVADMLTVARAVKEPVIGDRDVTGGTITFAVADVDPMMLLLPLRATFAVIPLLLCGALNAIPTFNVVVAVAPGAMLGVALMNAPVQPEGTMLVKLKAPATQPVVSLFFTLTV